MISNIAPLGWLGKPDEIAKAVMFLACDATSYITEKLFADDGFAQVQVSQFENSNFAVKKEDVVSIRRFEIDRFSVTSSRPFEAVVAALKASVGRLDLVEVSRASHSAATFVEVRFPTRFAMELIRGVLKRVIAIRGFEGGPITTLGACARRKYFAICPPWAAGP